MRMRSEPINRNLAALSGSEPFSGPMRAIPASAHAFFDVDLDSGLAVRIRTFMQTMLVRSVRGRISTRPCVGLHSLSPGIHPGHLAALHRAFFIPDVNAALDCWKARRGGRSGISVRPGGALQQLSRYHPSWSWTAEPARRIDPSKFSAPSADGRSFWAGSSSIPCVETLVG